MKTKFKTICCKFEFEEKEKSPEHGGICKRCFKRWAGATFKINLDVSGGELDQGIIGQLIL